MFRQTGARSLAAIHHSTFVLSHEPPDEPLTRLLAAAGPAADQVVLRAIGATFVLPP